MNVWWMYGGCMMDVWMCVCIYLPIILSTHLCMHVCSYEGLSACLSVCLLSVRLSLV